MPDESRECVLPDAARPVTFRLPTDVPFLDQLDQDEEWCEVLTDDDTWRRIRFHDYHEIFRIPGLYESLFYDRLACCSPARVVGLLGDVLDDYPDRPSDLRVLDVGAGNGMVGEELRRLGVSAAIAADLLPEAREAAARDRPGVYDDYLVGDLTALGSDDMARLGAIHPNCLTSVAALGYGDVPADVFIAACNLVTTPGWLAFNIKESFLDERSDTSGLAAPLRRMQEAGLIKLQAYRRYRHRLSVAGEPLYYVAMVAQKIGAVPPDMVRM